MITEEEIDLIIEFKIKKNSLYSINSKICFVNWVKDGEIGLDIIREGFVKMKVDNIIEIKELYKEEVEVK